MNEIVNVYRKKKSNFARMEIVINGEVKFKSNIILKSLDNDNAIVECSCFWYNAEIFNESFKIPVPKIDNDRYYEIIYENMKLYIDKHIMKLPESYLVKFKILEEDWQIYNHKYLSMTDLGLVSGIPGTLTVEDYNKWYNLFYINKNGEVKVPRYQDEIEGIDHYYYPSSVIKYAKKYNLKIDHVSYAAICYMYLEDAEVHEIPEDHLPTKKDLISVLVDGNTNNTDICYCDNFYIFPKHFTKEMCIECFSKEEDYNLKFLLNKLIDYISVGRPISETIKILSEQWFDIDDLKSFGFNMIDILNAICIDSTDYDFGTIYLLNLSVGSEAYLVDSTIHLLRIDDIVKRSLDPDSYDKETLPKNNNSKDIDYDYSGEFVMDDDKYYIYFSEKGV